MFCPVKALAIFQGGAGRVYRIFGIVLNIFANPPLQELYLFSNLNKWCLTADR
jgi:hypothetical protein